MFQSRSLAICQGFSKAIRYNFVSRSIPSITSPIAHYATAPKGKAGKGAPAKGAEAKPKSSINLEDIEINPYSVVDPDSGVSFGEFCDRFDDFVNSSNLGDMQNPLLKPGEQPWKGMIGDKTQEDIYNLHKNNPQKWTVRKLANLYNTEMLRIEAIICLKDIERRMVQLGYQVDSDFTEKYEEMCGYPEYIPLDKLEDHYRVNRVNKVDPWGELDFNMKPKFKIVKEDELVTSKSLFASKEPSPIAPLYENKATDIGGQVLLKNPIDKSRNTFVFTEMSKKQRGKVWVKEQDGTLRTGTHQETHNEKRRFGLMGRSTLPYITDGALKRFIDHCDRLPSMKLDTFTRVGEDEEFDRFKKYARGFIDRYSRGPAARKRQS